VPYLAVGLVHVAILALQLDFAAITKPLLMPLLAVALLLSVRRLTAPVLLALGAIAFSWFGDVVPIFLADSTIVMIGLFLVAHVFYLILFLRHLGLRRVPWWTFVYGLWWISLLVVLAPNLGSLLIPVAVYGLLLGAVAVTAARSTHVITVGAALFLISDSLLAIRLFAPGLSYPLDDAVIMACYIGGQGLIIYGLVRVLRSAQLVEQTPDGGDQDVRPVVGDEVSRPLE
jgi:uncharacterized membrane protein YhhN